MNINFWLSIILLFSFESLCAQEGSESIPKLIQQKQYTEAISLCDQTILKTNEPNEKSRILIWKAEATRFAVSNAEAIKILSPLSKDLSLHDSIRYDASFNLGMCYYRESKLVDATNAFAQAKELSKKLYGPDHKAYFSCLNNLGQMYKEQAKFRDAELTFLEAKNLQFKNNKGQELQYARICNNLADVYCALNKFDKAEDLYQVSLRIKEKTSGRNSKDYSKTLYNLAKYYDALGKYNLALATIDSATLAYHNAEDLDLLKILDLKSIIYIHHEKYEDAEKLILDLLAKRKSAQQEHSSEYALSLMNIGFLYIEMKRGNEAIQQLESALEKCKQIYGLNHPYTASAFTSLADANTLIKNYSKANDIYDQASKILLKYYGKDHFEYFINQFHYAKLLRLTGKSEEAKKIFVSIDEIPKNYINKLSKYLSERELENLIKIFKEYNQELYSLTQQRKDDAQLCIMSFENAIYYKAYILESLSKLRNAIVAAKSIQTIQDQLISLTRQLEAELKLPETERKNIAALENEINSLETQMKSEINSISKEDRRISFDDIRQSLRSEDAAVECITFLRGDSTYYAALVITSDREFPEFVDLSSEDLIKKLIHPAAERQADYVSYIYDFQKRGVVPTAGEKKHLYDLIWAPLLNSVSGKQKIYFSNSGYLHRIALQAIPVALDQVIADQYNIIYVNSTRDVMLQFEQSDIAYNSKAMLIGGLEYDASPNAAMQTNKPRGATTETIWQYLPWTEKEVTEIQKICQGASLASTVITKNEANEKRILAAINEEFPRVIHFSTHGVFTAAAVADHAVTATKAQSYDMTSSALVLSGANELKWNVHPEADGYLSALEISKMDLSKTELAVLSACETGLGTIDQQEGVYGLQRAFQIAGVKNIIFSLWQVPDRETKDFMANFYRNWLEKKLSIRAAFTLTQKEMRERFINPFQWAGFVLVE